MNFDNLVEDAENININSPKGELEFELTESDLKALITQYILADRAASGEAVGTVTITNGGLYQDTSIKRGLPDGKHALFTRSPHPTARVGLIMTNPNESNELIETIKEVRESLYKVSGSALLAGEKCKSEDKAIIYGLVCNANNLLLFVIDILAAQARLATPQPQTVRSALKILDRALIEPLSADEHKEHQDKYHDLIALRASRKVMALNNEPVMPTSQLQARIQCIIYDAIKELP